MTRQLEPNGEAGRKPASTLNLSATATRAGIAALVLSSAGFAYLLVLFVLSRIVELQGVPKDEDHSVTGEAYWFLQLYFFSAIPMVLVAAAILFCAPLAMNGIDRSTKRMGVTSFILLLCGVPIAFFVFRTWAGSGW